MPGPPELSVAFGRELQQERERRNISLTLIAERTKVPERHLIALEHEDFNVLPGGVFSRGIVRSYCQQVGLNEKEWLARFPLNETTEGWVEFASNVQRNRVPSGPQMRMRWWGVLLMLAVLGALSWATWRYFVQPQGLRSFSAAVRRSLT
jgi:cytoskeletal protein RodZ